MIGTTYIPFRPPKGETFTIYFGLVGVIGSPGEQNLLAGKTITVRVSKDGGARALATNGPATSIDGGIYSIALTADEMNANAIVVTFDASSNNGSGGYEGVIVIYTDGFTGFTSGGGASENQIRKLLFRFLNK